MTVSFVSAIALLATLDLAARAVPRRAEGTFFAALMSVMNLGTTGAAWVGGHLYDLVGLNWLIAISATALAACWLLVPWVRSRSPRPPEDRPWRRAPAQRVRMRGSRRSRRPSPRRLKPSTVTAIAQPGRTAIQGSISMY